MVPLYSGTPFIILSVLGSFHSLVPVASPIKLATVSGALSGKRVQVILPAVVSMTAVGSTGFSALFSVAACCCEVVLPVAGVFVVVCAVMKPVRLKHRMVARK